MTPTTIEEAARLHLSIAAHCKHGHSSSYEAQGVWWRFHSKGWDMRLTEAKEHFYCRMCFETIFFKIRAERLEVVGPSDLDIQLPLPPEREWKKAIRRAR